MDCKLFFTVFNGAELICIVISFLGRGGGICFEINRSF